MTTKRDIARKEARFYGREALRAIVNGRVQVDLVREIATFAAQSAHEYLRLKRASERSAAISEAYRSCGMRRTRYGWE